MRVCVCVCVCSVFQVMHKGVFSLQDFIENVKGFSTNGNLYVCVCSGVQFVMK